MTSENYLYSAALLLAGIVCFLVAMLVASQRRPLAPGSIPLIVLLLALSWWDITYGLFWAGVAGPTPFFWLDLTYLGVVIAPTAFLIFAIQISVLGHWLKPPLMFGLCVEPTFVLLVLWTDPWHDLFFGGERLANTSLILAAGPVFWVNLVYSYLLLLMGFAILLRRFWQASGLYRRQIGLVLAGVAVIWLNSGIFILGLSPFPNADNTPFSFTFGALFFAFALLRYQLLDLAPIARDTLIEQMSDGVVVLDAQNRIVDVNAHAQSVLPRKPRIGEPVDSVFDTWPEMIKEFGGKTEGRAEVLLQHAAQIYLDIQITPLRDRHGQFLGKLIVWRDISEFKGIQNDLEIMATVDPLTQVFNRRRFFELAEQAVAQAAHAEEPLSLMIIDIDHFKSINDLYGHLVGDQVLVSFAQHCLQNIRPADIFARSGGEEFVLLAPNTDLDKASALAAHLCQTIGDLPIPLEDGTEVRVTASIGVACRRGSDEPLKAFLRRADKALYHAKQHGRNCAARQVGNGASIIVATTAEAAN